MMNYPEIYDRLVARARDRDIDGYTEKHHVVPRCMGGTNAKANLVRLTAEEHFLAHLLLIKVYPGQKSLIFAAIVMCGKTAKVQRGNKAFGWLRRKNAQAVRGFRHSAETIAKLSAGRTGIIVPREIVEKTASANRGRKHSDEARLKMSDTRRQMVADGQWHGFVKGQKHSPEMRAKVLAGREANPITRETRAKISAAAKGRTYGPEARANMATAAKKRAQIPISDETRRRMSESQKGRVVSLETRRKKSAAMTGKKISPEVRQRRLSAKRTLTPENKAKISRKGIPHSPATRAKMSASKKGRAPHIMTPEMRAKISAGHRRRRGQPSLFEGVSA